MLRHVHRRGAAAGGGGAWEQLLGDELLRLQQVLVLVVVPRRRGGGEGVASSSSSSAPTSFSPSADAGLLRMLNSSTARGAGAGWRVELEASSAGAAPPQQDASAFSTEDSDVPESLRAAAGGFSSTFRSSSIAGITSPPTSNQSTRRTPIYVSNPNNLNLEWPARSIARSATFSGRRTRGGTGRSR
ncbi:hypothetical protein ZWY2020_028708 [Hordeum vulgare]|nr:hypothetical protein ZWY2020_028708 [Hordeum vulgare]